MIARRFLVGWITAGALALGVPMFAQKPANTPKGATAQCNDNTFSTAKTERGACSKHGGVKTRWGPTGTVDTPPKTTGATTPPKASSPAKGTSSSASAAPA